MPIFYLDCELDSGIDRAYLSDCPLWCFGDFQTKNFCLDFTAQGYSDNDNIFETDSITDSLGNPWRFNGVDTTTTVGTYQTDLSDCGEVYNITVSTTSNSNQLEIIPNRISSCEPNPVINFSFPWTIMVKTQIIDGGFDIKVDSGDAPSINGNPCGPDVTISFRHVGSKAIDDSGNVDTVQVTGTLRDICNRTRNLPTVWCGPDVDCCISFGLSVDPCANAISYVLKVPTGGSCIASFVNPDATPSAASVKHSVNTTLEFSQTCYNWFQTQPDKGFMPTGINKFQPASLVTPFWKRQGFSIDFVSVAAAINLDLHKICIGNSFKTLSELGTDLDNM